MNDLLNLAVEAHGGLKRWSRVEAVTVAASITGEIWQTKSKPDYLKNVIFNAETKRERVTMDFPGQDKRSRFEPNRVEMQRRDGTVVATRDDPEASFQGQEQFTPWDDLDVAYFSGEALYTYCNTPFLCTYDGFSSEEIPPIQVDAETWRRLKVTFPDTVKSHTKTQTSVLVRMAYYGVMTTRWTSLVVHQDSTTPPIIEMSSESSSPQSGESMHTKATTES